MATMTLYSGPLSMFGAKAQIAALEKGLPIEIVMVPFTDDHRYEPRHPEVLRVNPKRQVPVLLHGEVELFDSTQIFEYFEDLKPVPPLWPASPAARAAARLRELWSDEIFFPQVIKLMGLQGRLTDAPARAAIAEIERHYATLEALIARSDFLAGDYGYADIAFFMSQLFAARMGAPMNSMTPRLLAWRDRVSMRPAVDQLLRQFAATLARLRLQIPDFVERAVASKRSP
jgi:glutathione S-transferase